MLPALTLLSLLFQQQTACAMSAQTWNFHGTVPAGTTVQHLTTAESTPEGLYIETQTDGFLQFPGLTSPADVVRLRVTNAAPAEIAVLWRTDALEPGEYYQKNVLLPAGEGKEATLLLHQVPEWTWSAPFIGIAFPAGTRLMIEEMEWRHYTLAEKTLHAWRSFWTTDQFRLYSINFLWGPLLATTPEARATLYDALPPSSWSATRVFYVVLIGIALALLSMRWFQPNMGTKRLLAIFAIAGSAMWIVFDMRMTQEILAYVRDDWRSYVLKEQGERTLRSHVTLYDALYTINNLLGTDARYVLIAEENTPFFSNVRYALYPATPVLPSDDTTGIQAWVVLGREDISVQDNKIIRSDGTVLVEGGTVVHRFDEISFFYRRP